MRGRSIQAFSFGQHYNFAGSRDALAGEIETEGCDAGPIDTCCGDVLPGKVREITVGVVRGAGQVPQPPPPQPVFDVARNKRRTE